MINYLELNCIAEDIKTNNNDMTVWSLVDVYEKPNEFYEPPRHIISASIPSKYIQRYKKCFDKNYTIVINHSVCIDVGSFTG